MAINPKAPTPPRRKRKNRDLEKLPRQPSMSYLYRAAEAAAPPNHPPVKMYSPAALWDWIRNYLSYAFKKKNPFPDYWLSPTNALYDLLDEDRSDSMVKVSLAGDWGTGTDEAERVAAVMQRFDPHFTIHLGDVYYVGDPPEINENCLGIRNPNNNYDPVVWPIGRLGSFALNGNHEMYANGTAYFNLFLPKLGLRTSDGKTRGQQTSFFCLQNRYWRMIALDTGYNSTGLPVLSMIPGLNKIPGIGPSCKLEDKLMDWLASQVAPANDNRGIVLLAHHQYFSAFEEGYGKPARQSWEAGVRRPVLWFWGHEHRLAGYDLGGQHDLKAWGRCIGHGGMPIDLKSVNHDPKPRFYDNRIAPSGFGVNGHVNLTFEGPLLKTSYVDMNAQELLTEQWSVDANGGVRLDAINKVTPDPNFIFMQS